MSKTNVCTAVALLLWLASGTGVRAQAPLKDAPKATAKERAKAFFARAESNYRLEEFKKALADYKAALKLHHHPNILFNIAQCYRRMKAPDKALFFYKLFLADWARLKPGTRPSNHVEVEGHVKRLEIEIKVRETKRAQDERDKKRFAAERLALERAKLALLAKQRTTTARPDKKKGPALLRIDGLDAVLARVLVDGQHKATTPITTPIVVEPGILKVQIRARGYRTWEKQVQVGPGGEAILRVKLDRESRSSFWLGSTIAAGVLAAAAEALAIVFTVQAKDHYEGTPNYQSDRNLAIGGHVAAGVLGAYAAMSLVFYLRSGRTDDRLRAMLAPTSGGVVAAAVVRF